MAVGKYLFQIDRFTWVQGSPLVDILFEIDNFLDALK